MIISCHGLWLLKNEILYILQVKNIVILQCIVKILIQVSCVKLPSAQQHLLCFPLQNVECVLALCKTSLLGILSVTIQKSSLLWLACFFKKVFFFLLLYVEMHRHHCALYLGQNSYCSRQHSVLFLATRLFCLMALVYSATPSCSNKGAVTPWHLPKWSLQLQRKPIQPLQKPCG